MARRMRASGRPALVKPFIHDEPDVPVRRGDEQQRVHEREMIGDEQGPAFGGDVVPALDVDAVDRAREHPEDEAEQGVRQQPDHIDRADQGQHAAEERPAAGQLENGGQKVMRPEAFPPKESRLAAASISPFLSLSGRCWSRAENRHDEEAAGKTERQAHHGPGERQAVQCQQGRDDREPDRAEGHQAILNLPPGQVTGRHAAARCPGPAPALRNPNCFFPACRTSLL